MLAKLVLVPVAGLAHLLLLYTLVQLGPAQHHQLAFPASLEDIRQVAAQLAALHTQHPAYILSLFSLAYLFKQTFAIPGSVFMNVLAGAVWGAGPGLVLCSALTALGATACCLLARAVGREAAVHFCPDRVERFAEKLEEHKADLPYFLLALRLFPMSPNWALNMASGVLGVPLHLFSLSVLVGLLPYNYLCVTSGALLSEVKEIGDILSWANMGRCAGIALAALTPSLVRWLRGEHSDISDKKHT